MTSKKTIISLYYKHKAGGFTTRLYKAWTGLANADYRVIYIASEELPVVHEKIQAHLIRCKAREGSALFWLEYSLKAIFAARRIAKQESIDSFLVFSFFYSALALLAGWGREINTLVFIRADDLHDATFKTSASFRTRVHQWLERFSMKYAAIVVATNHDMMKVLKHRNPEARAQLDTLPNNIVNADTDYSSPRYSEKDDVFRFVTTAVLNERKNLMYALKALQTMTMTNWEYYIIGADVEKTGYGQQLEAFVQAHNLEDKVKMLGWQDNASEQVARCDLFILPTTMEGSPNALLEALGTRIPCMGSDIPEVAELLAFPELVFDLNDPADLGQRLDKFCREQAYRDHLSTLSLKCRERYVFDWEQRVIQFVERVSPKKSVGIAPQSH